MTPPLEPDPTVVHVVKHVQYDGDGRFLDLDFNEGFTVRVPSYWLYWELVRAVASNWRGFEHKPHVKSGNIPGLEIGTSDE